MRLIVNGQEQDFETEGTGLTVADLLDRLQTTRGAAAVEVNRTLVPRRSHPERRLEDGDQVEIVSLVGGG
ncbi:MAG: sulfur carrier protein ThiS [Phycisphaerae bacterium]|nr:sulfur carrier protein ThiS [Phycisphaerae bacterium]